MEAVYWQYRVSMAFLLLFVYFFLPTAFSKVKAWLLLGACFAITGVVEYVEFIQNSMVVNTVVCTIVEAVILQLIVIWFSPLHYTKALFIGITASTYVLSGNLLWTVMLLLTDNYVIAFFVQILIHSGILAGLIYTIRKPLINHLENSPDQGWLAWCLVPCLCYMTVYSLSVWPQSIYETTDNALPLVFVLIIMISLYILMIRLVEQREKAIILQQNNDHMDYFVNRLKNEMIQLEKSERMTAIVRHDMRHYAAMIDMYLDSKDYDKIKEMLMQMNETLERAKPTRFCQNMAVNGVLSYCQSIADELHVQTKYDLDIPDKMLVNEVEFAAVLSNLVENGINAAAETVQNEKRRFVKVSLYQQKKKIILEVSNSFEGKLKVSEVSGMPQSEKGAGHGNGMRSLQAFNEKYDTLFDFSVENGVYIARLVIFAGKEC